MSDILNKAVEAVNKSQNSFCHFIVANEVGETGGHQCGFLIPKKVWPMFFAAPGIKGENKDKLIRINWQDGSRTDSRVIYYGKGTRNEYRLTRFGRAFPYLQKECAGNLLVIAKLDADEYAGYVLERDEDIEEFLANFDISPERMNSLIKGHEDDPEKILASGIEEILSAHHSFPTTREMSDLARALSNKANNLSLNSIRQNPDKALVAWINAEFSLFQAFENQEFVQRNTGVITDCQGLIDYANSLTNRRKARAGKSLEHHLSSMFDINELQYEEQVVTEGNKKPDFIFPGSLAYHNMLFPGEALTFLGAKTTCKDRWRQVLNEADRIPHKYLFTLQQGISSNQLQEMKDENLSLVVPKPYISTFDSRYHDNILSLSQFICKVREKQNKYYPV